MPATEYKIIACRRQWPFIIVCIICFFVTGIHSVFASVLSVELNSNWRFRKSGDNEWLPATVPGTVHTDLFDNKKIRDPFFGTNEKKLQWIDTCSWEYDTWFDGNAEIISSYHCELQFEGLDTYAKVYLNDSLILIAENMFRTWRIECNKFLRPEKNHLVVIFESAVKRGREAVKKNQPMLPGDEKVYTRKAQYQYGWDWGPRFAGCGIWRPVQFVAWNALRINNVQLSDEMLNDSISEISAWLNITADKASMVYIKIILEGATKDSFYFEQPLTFPLTENIEADLEIKNPMLWSCNGSGKQNLYRITIQVMDPDRQSDVFHTSYGLRKIELVQEKDKSGSSFYFKVNDEPVFMKGANWIPADHFLPRVTKNKYRELLTAAKDANMNMIRVWGGGVYEDNAFYELCDSLGILVWQDFMFACAMYPGDAAFSENVRSEIIDNVTRLRNHPCIALWCGNNEIDEGWKNWGWQKQYSYSAKDSAEIWKNYLGLFREMIPGLLSKLDPTRSYWESSPSIGWGHEESLRSGDSHYWGVWWGMEPFETYLKKTGRFMSEYGFQGMPSMKAIELFAGSGERKLNSAAMKNHQKHPAGFETIEHYMRDWYKKPKDFESYVYISQLLQADGMRTAIESHRRAKPYCMGSLFWQLNDCWPVTSWSSIDFSGEKKAVYYAAKKSFEKYLISVVDTGANFSVYVVSDDTIDQNGQLKITVLDFLGNVLSTEVANATLSKNAGVRCYSDRMDEMRSRYNPFRTVIKLELFKGETLLTRNLYYFNKPKDLLMDKKDIGVSYDVFNDNTGGILKLTSKNLSKNVYLDTPGHETDFSENYFDLLPGETRTIFFQTSLSEHDFRMQLLIRTVSDTY
jgi:beta-mannosidase